MSDHISDAPYDVLIVGGGLAGLSAALVLGRARRNVLVVDAGEQRNRTADETHGFVTREGAHPLDLVRTARSELQRYPSVRLRNDTVGTLAADGQLFLASAQGERSILARRVILATGMTDDLPPIEELSRFWGHRVFTCPYCDGWEMRDRRIVIAGQTKNLAGLAQELYQWSRRLTICGVADDACASDERRWISNTGIATHAHEIRRLEGTGIDLAAVTLDNGDVVETDAVFLCVPLVQRSPFPKELGCRLTEHGRVEVDHRQKTSIEGVFAVGDASEHVHQVLVAAASGARAAIHANEDLTREDVALSV